MRPSENVCSICTRVFAPAVKPGPAPTICSDACRLRREADRKVRERAAAARRREEARAAAFDALVQARALELLSRARSLAP